MSSPPVHYARQANFTDYQSAHPTDPPLGSDMDAELNAVATALNKTEDRLAEIQRADGALKNAVVTPDSLSTAALALIAGVGTPKGSWLTATAYVGLDLVAINGNSYIAVIAHTSGVFATDLAAGKWMLFSNGLAPWVYNSGTDAMTLATATFGYTGAMSVTGSFNITQTQDSASLAGIANASGGANAIAGWSASNNGSHSIVMRMHGTAVVTSGLTIQNGALIRASAGATGGLALDAGGGPLRSGVANTEVSRLISDRLLVGKTAGGLATIGCELQTAGAGNFTVSASEAINVIRLVSNGTMIRFFHTDAATVIGSISTSGGTTTSYNTSSDEAFKEDIKPASDVGHLIDSAPVSEFNWKETGDKQLAGFIAQDLLETLAPVVPGLVNEREDGLLEYDPSKLVPLLWKELQSMRARVAALEARP